MAYTEVIMMSMEITKQIMIYLSIFLLIFAGKEVTNKLKRTFYRRKAIEVELIGPDRKSAIVVCKKKDDSHYEVDGLPFFINSLKAIERDKVKVFTHVLGNSFAHDWVTDPKEALKKIIQEAKDEKKIKVKKGEEILAKDLTDKFHNVFDEPYRVDARMLQEVLINAQLSNKTLWDELIKIFKSKNFVTLMTVLIIGVGLTLLLAYQTHDAVIHMKACVPSAEISV